jgi:hypothetical protein
MVKRDTCFFSTQRRRDAKHAEGVDVIHRKFGYFFIYGIFNGHDNPINSLRPLRRCAFALKKPSIKKAPAGGAFLQLFEIVASSRNHADGFAISGATNLEFYAAIGRCEQGMVSTHADVIACVKLGTALANNDVTSQNVLTAELFHAQAFGFRFAAVSGTTRCFLMCHCLFS